LSQKLKQFEVISSNLSNRSVSEIQIVWLADDANFLIELAAGVLDFSDISPSSS
jgi:hypothetical protein